MKIKNIIRLINEEVSNFDYLNQNELQEENNMETFLKSDEFQKHLVYDLANNFKNPEIFKDVKVVEETSNADQLQPDSTQKLNVSYIVDFVYNYNGKDLPLSIIIEANDIWQDLELNSSKGDRFTPSTTDATLNFDWDDFQIKVMHDGETEVELDWLYKNKEFNRKFLQRFVGHLLDV